MLKVNIVDSCELNPEMSGITILWSGELDQNRKNVIPVGDLLVGKEKQLRSDFLGWVHRVGSKVFAGKTVIEHLCLRENFSYWWMTRLAHKSNFALSPQIDDAIKFLAFIGWAKAQSINEISLFTQNVGLYRCLELWCKDKSILFSPHKCSPEATVLSFGQRLTKILPDWLNAFLWLGRFVVSRWPLRNLGLDEWRETKARTTFFTFSSNCVDQKLNQFRYKNRYWGPLPDICDKGSLHTNWLHIYVRDKLLPTPRHAAKMFAQMNLVDKRTQCHTFLESFVNGRVLLRSIKDWLCLQKKRNVLRQSLKYQMSTDPLWQFFDDEWWQHLRGRDALHNLLFLNLFYEAFRVLPLQKRGVYLQENLPWEFALIEAWRKSGHSALIGSPHTIVRFWDLRYFYDRAGYGSVGALKMPLPDKVACNGPAMRKAYELGEYPSDMIIDVEALRYLDIKIPETNDASGRVEKQGSVQLLVLGDYLPENTKIQLDMLVKALRLVGHRIEVTVKLHPNCLIDKRDFSSCDAIFVDDDINKLLRFCDIAYCGSVTTAALDAYCRGIPTISYSRQDRLNLSPLWGQKNVFFAKTPHELAKHLTFIIENPAHQMNKPKYFNLDSDLTRWRLLLSI